MARPYAPCKDCPDRHEACHGHCEKFIEFRRGMDEWKNEAGKEKARQDIDAYEARRRHRLWKMMHPRAK